MKLAKLMLSSSALWAAMVSHANADPVSLIATAIHGFLLSSTAVAATAAGTIATIAANVIVGGAVVAASLFGAQRPKGGAIKPSDAKNTFETGESSVIEGVGRVRVGGLQAFGNTDGSTRARLVCRLQGPVDAFETYYLGGREVIVEANGDVSSPPWARPGGSWANWKDKVGTGTETAWSGLLDLFPTLWTSAHRVRGIAQSQLLFYNPGLAEEKYLSLYQNGAPNSEVIARGSRIYDPFDEDCDPDIPATWVWSENSVLVCAHVLRRDPAFSAARFNWPRITVEAVKAQATVATRTGTEKRSRLWGMWAWESERGDTMHQFLDSAGLEIRLDENGLIYFELIDDEVTPEISFEPRDMYDYGWQSGPEAVDRPNICRLRYYSPERNYELADLNLAGIAWAVVQDEVDRYGPKYLDIELPFCPSAAQAQRIARRKFAVARADRVRMVTNMVGLAAWGLLYAQIEEPDLGDILNVRMEAPRIDDENGSVEIPCTVWPSLPAWNPSVDEALPPEVIPELGYESNLITPNSPNAAIQITYPNGAKELRLGYSLPAQAYNIVEANFRTYTGGLPNAWQGMNEIGGNVAWEPGDFLGQTIGARVRVFNGDDGSYFSEPANLTVGSDNTPCSAPVLVTGGNTTEQLGGLDVKVRATDVQCAAIRLQRKVALGAYETIDTKNARPMQELTFVDPPVDGQSPGTVIARRLQTLTSDGTAGTALIFEYTVPDEGGSG
jgi:hypothetical protein